MGNQLNGAAPTSMPQGQIGGLPLQQYSGVQPNGNKPVGVMPNYMNPARPNV